MFKLFKDEVYEAFEIYPQQDNRSGRWKLVNDRDGYVYKGSFYTEQSAQNRLDKMLKNIKDSVDNIL